MKIKVSPSLAAAPTDRLGEVITQLEEAGADYIHFDIEDGSFVPVMTLGTKIISDLRPLTTIPFDLHLMMVNPDWIIPQLVEQGADRIAVHVEACPYPRRTLGLIKSLKIEAGIALNPISPLPALNYLLPYLDFVVLLSTEPEVEGSPFLPEILQKLKQGREVYQEHQLEWVIDGGVNFDNLSDVVAAGADTVVIGRSMFNNGSVKNNMQQFRKITGLQ